MCELSLAAGLTRVAGIDGGRLGDGLLIGYLRLADVGFHLELTQESVDDDLQMELTHAGNDRLARLLVRVGLEGRVLFRQLLERDGHLLLARLRLGLDRHANDGIGEFHGLQDDGVLLVAERIAGRGVFQAHRRGDIAGIDLLKVFSVVGVHQQDAAQALTLSLGGVHDRLAGLQRAGIDTEETQLAHIGVGHDLKGQRREGRLIGGVADLGLIGLGIDTLDSRDIQRRGHIIDDRVEQLLYAFVFVGSAAGDGDHFHRTGGLPDRRTDLVRRDFFAFEICFHDLFVEVGDSFQQLIAVLLSEGTHILGDLLGAHILAEIIVINSGVHIHKVDNTFEAVFTPDRKLDRNGIALEPLMHHVQHTVEIRAGDVHLVDVDHPGNMIVVGLSPDGFRLGFHAALGAQDRHAAVKHSQGAFDLGGKVHMARGVNDVDARVPPMAGGGGRGDGDAALLLLLHPVHRGSAFMGLTELVVDARVEQDAFRRGRLSGVDMSHDADISRFFK